MKWLKSKHDENLIDVVCSHCGTTQMISENLYAGVCKKCKKTIYTKNAAKNKTMVKEVEKAPDSDIIANKPAKSETIQAKAESSTNTSKSSAPKQTDSSPSSISSGMKPIRCSNCSTEQEVPSIALASFCEKCGQRINLQDYKIKGHFHGELETRGEIRIASGAQVHANLNVGSAVVNGRIEGAIIAESQVKLNDGCIVIGTIKSPVLLVESGAGFVGKAIINPPANMNA